MQAAPADASGPVIHQHGFEITAFRLLPIKNHVQVTVLRRPGRFVSHIEEVLAWYRITPYQKPEDWVFASDSPRAGAKRGKQPYWPMTIMRMFIKPVAKRLGIGNISWHTFRHTYSNLLHANREDPKVVQELLRHSSIKVTMDVYTQVVTSEKRKAQSRVVELIAPRPRPEAGNAHHLS